MSLIRDKLPSDGCHRKPLGLVRELGGKERISYSVKREGEACPRPLAPSSGEGGWPGEHSTFLAGVQCDRLGQDWGH